MRSGNEARTCVIKVTNQSICTMLSLSGLGHSTCVVSVCVCVCVRTCACVWWHVCVCREMKVSRRFTITMGTNSKLSLFKIMLCHTVTMYLAELHKELSHKLTLLWYGSG